MHDLERFWAIFQSRQSQDEMVCSALGACVGIALVAWVSYHLVDGIGFPFIVASMGAAAVLLYAAPHSPLTGPWAFVGGHLISACIGVTCAMWVPEPFLASGLAVGLAIFAMHELNCLHPPGGAAALVAVIGGDQIHALGYSYVLMPVALNVLILGVSVWVTRLLLARRASRLQPISMEFHHHEGDSSLVLNSNQPFSRDDLHHALQGINTYIDVSIDDLQDIYARATLIAHRRNLGDLYCQDIMSCPVVTVEFGDTLQDTWGKMQQHEIKSLPVINRANRVIGIITVCDFKTAASVLAGASTEEQLHTLIRPSPSLHSSKPDVAGQLMIPDVITLMQSDPAIHAAEIFNAHEISHIPILNEAQRLVGMVSRTDVS